jgi:stearoyl-CoA desaturase (delta-9 desaturase)
VPQVVIPLAVGLALCQVAILLTTVYLHRALAHRSVHMSPGLSWACRVFTWLLTGIRPRQWVAVHRKHHAYTDVEGDPHSPVLRGWAAVQFGNVWMYRTVANDDAAVARYARDLPADRWDRILFDHAFVGLSFGIALLCLTLGWQAGLVASVVHAVTYLLLNAAVNAVGHTWGGRPYGGWSGNSQWLAWLTAGEGLHNNHHAASTSARLSMARGEMDPGWWFIRLARRLGWLTVRHETPRPLHRDGSGGSRPTPRQRDRAAA